MADDWFTGLARALFTAPADWTLEWVASAFNVRLVPRASTRYREDFLIEIDRTGGVDQVPAGVRGEAARGGPTWRVVSFTMDPSLRLKLRSIERLAGRHVDDFTVLPPEIDASQHSWRVAGGSVWVREGHASRAVVGLGLSHE